MTDELSTGSSGSVDRHGVGTLPDVLIESTCFGLPFVRFYLLDGEGIASVRRAAEQYDYVFVYSRADLGEIDGFAREQKWAQVIILDRSREDLFASLGQRARQEIRKTYRDDGLSVVIDDKASDEAYRFYCEIKEGDGVKPDIVQDFASVRWVTCHHKGALVAANSFYDTGRVFRGKHIASIRKNSKVDPALIGRINRRLLWEICVLGLSQKRIAFDMGGLDFDDPTKFGITKYKQRFGGETVPIYVYRHVTAAWSAALKYADDQGRTIL